MWFAALNEKRRAVMTRGDGTDAEPTRYLGIYVIDEVELVESDLRFRVTKRLSPFMSLLTLRHQAD